MKSIQELAEEQGIEVPQNLESLIGAGADLWESDEDFEEFLRRIGDWELNFLTVRG